MGNVWIVIFLILFGFRVSSLEPSMPSYESQQEDEALSHRDGYYFTTTVRGRLREDMPEFSFDVEARFNKENSCYQIKSVTVRQEEKTLQVISVPELSLFGETAVWSDQEEYMGLELEDLNFDGYKDIRLFDTANGNYLLEWIYLVWNPETERFDHDARLNEIPLASFDQEDQLIYGMERGGAMRHYFKTYQYLEGEPVKIREEHSVFLTETDPEVVRRCLSGAAGDRKIEAGEAVEICRETVWERNPDTGEMEQTQDIFRFFLVSSNDEDGVLTVEADSEMGRLLSVY